MKEKTLQPIGAALSVGIHLALLFIGGTTLMQKAQYGESNQSTEVELVAAPEEIKAPKEVVPQINADDMARYKPKKNKSPTPPPEKATPPPAASSVASGPRGPVSAKPDYLRNPPPPYPQESKLAHEEGLVILLVDVSESGRATAVHVQKSSGFRRLDEAAVVTVQSWMFKAGTLDGAPVKSQVEVPVRFRLQND